MFLVPLGLALSAALANADDGVPPCTVRAWVRADDLWPNAVSYGELKVKVTQPCTETVQSVVLRLRLDESAEQSKLFNTTASGEFWDWDGDVPSAEWTTTREQRTAWKIERTVFAAGGSGEEHTWGDGREFKFAVHTPNVNFPPAVHPLIFRRRNSDTESVAFSRGYRYGAFVGLSSPAGDVRFVEVPAGYTAFQPVTLRSAIDTKPHEVVVEAVSKDAPWACPHAKAKSPSQNPPEDDPKDEEKGISLRVVMPNGPTAVQGPLILDAWLLRDADNNIAGQDFTIAISLPNREDHRSAATTYTRSARLEPNIHPTFAAPAEEPAPDSRNTPRRLRVSPFQFEELHARMWATALLDRRARRTTCEAPLADALRVRVPDTFPRTTHQTGTDAPFAVGAALVVSVTERAGAAHTNPLHDFAVAHEAGWEFGPCDGAQHATRTYTARIPVAVVGRHLVDVAVPDYLEGRDASAPCIAVPPESACAFGDGGSRSTHSTRNSLAPPVGEAHRRRYSMESVDPKAGQYVGALWQSKMQRLEPKLVPLVYPEYARADQLMMGGVAS
ncbi:hypothetical protein AURDEDRAFT_116979 [Auricularia subglabra TFB-10046 SS5]|uniref:Arrestin-like N-terminal domain-containing protein n=1 Tax=Auricularia subglabra (strain TFB-10046 / SS5) TaxID=717982 RepID=J0LGP7_AURST|nr:hypothetical protein AURDEDRAFT_116979 [Auricularia subglabra TFB-10046 SS5]